MTLMNPWISSISRCRNRKLRLRIARRNFGVAPNKIKERFFAFFYILDRARDFLVRVNVAIKEYIHSFMIKLLQNAYLKINAAYPSKLTLLRQHVKESFSPRHIYFFTAKKTLKTLRLKYQSGCHLKSFRRTLVNCQVHYISSLQMSLNVILICETLRSKRSCIPSDFFLAVPKKACPQIVRSLYAKQRI